MRDINHIRQIAEDEKVWLDENDTVSVKIWVTQLQQAGASVILKDKIDTAPAKSGLSQMFLFFAYRPLSKKSNSI